jgi:membrane associated rhomboid family serine protease
METRATGRRRQQASNEVHKKLYKLTIMGGVAFWAANFAISLTPIAPEYRAALSISYFPMIVESLIGGLIIGFLVSYFLLRFFDRIPTKNPILKSVILSIVALVIIEALSTLVNLGNPSIYILIGAAMNVPRFLALGIVIGWLYTNYSARGRSQRSSELIQDSFLPSK